MTGAQTGRRSAVNSSVWGCHGSVNVARTAPVLRRAVAEDLPALVRLLADDGIGASREGRDLAPYAGRVPGDRRGPGAAARGRGRRWGLIGTLQLTVVPGLARGGALRGQLEAVRVGSSRRGSGLGAALVGWAVEEARRRGCALVQLTTDKRRTDAHRFYERLGLIASHEGFKRELQGRPGERPTLVPGPGERFRRAEVCRPRRVATTGLIRGPHHPGTVCPSP